SEGSFVAPSCRSRPVATERTRTARPPDAVTPVTASSWPDPDTAVAVFTSSPEPCTVCGLIGSRARPSGCAGPGLSPPTYQVMVLCAFWKPCGALSDAAGYVAADTPNVRSSSAAGRL